MNEHISVLITDLDNTLYDWVDIWYKSFRSMLDRLVLDAGIPEEVLIPEFKRIHEKHRTAEYSFSLQELPSLIAKYPGEDLPTHFRGAIDAFREARRAALRLYPGVAQTLMSLKDSGCLLVGYTESMQFYTNYRVRHLNLDGLLDYIYSPPDHALPDKLNRLYSDEHYVLRSTIHKTLDRGEVKPNQRVLLQIIKETGARIDECVYVGDSLMKDIFMAQKAGVKDVWARYGVAQSREEYELLRRVTHWTSKDVEAEKNLMPEQVNPTHTLHASFAELLDVFKFSAFNKRTFREPLKASGR